MNILGIIGLSDLITLLLAVFTVLLGGYALGRITIKGVSLGDAGVFIVALLVGALVFTMPNSNTLNFAFDSFSKEGIEECKTCCEACAAVCSKHGFYNYKSAFSLIQNLGLILFVTSVGYIAGPKFFGNLKKNFKSYVLLGLVIILAGGLAATACIFAPDLFKLVGINLGYGSDIENREGFVAMIVGLLSGSLTSTPAFSAASDTVAEELKGLVSVGHGISYIFGVVGVVLFVQLIPKLTKANMEEERAKLVVKSDAPEKKSVGKLFELDHMGIAGFSLAAILGILFGNIQIPLSFIGLNGAFALTTTGGCLMAGLVLGHFGRIGKVSIMPNQNTLKLFRELGLVLFLVGAGIPGGAEFVKYFDAIYLVYGVVMTIVPMFIGYLFAKYVLKLSLLNNLGSLTGGMTSTPALGTLIGVSGTEDVASAYAATYPIALVAVVLVSQLLIILIK